MSGRRCLAAALLLGSMGSLGAPLLACSGGSGAPASQTAGPRDGAPATEAARESAASLPLPTPPVPEVPIPADPDAPETPPEPGAVPLTEKMAESYFADGPAAAAAERFALEDWADARAGFARAARRAPFDRGEPHARVELMIALCDARLEHHAEAARGFRAALRALPALSDWLHYQAASSSFLAKDTGRALEHARAVAADSIVGADAAMLVGDLLRGGRGDLAAIAAHYRKYLTDRPDGYRMSEARYRLAEALEKRRGQTDEALALYRKITIAAPISRWAGDARKRIDALLASRPAAERAAFNRLDAAELIARGEVYFDNMRNAESEADYTAALGAPGLDNEMRCVAAYQRAQSVFKQRNRTRAAPLFDEAAAACEGTANLDLKVKAPYQAARSYSNIGDREKALARYQQAERVAGTEHTFGDDARVRQAEEQADLGNQAQVTELLSSLPTRYPAGDMRAEAMWRLAWRAYKDGKFDESIGWLRKQITLVPIDDNYWAEGQAQYWIGRNQERLGNPREAVAAYQETVRRYPVSYYAMLALNRLRERHGDAFKALVAEISAVPPGWTPDRPAFRFRPRALYASPGFQRAMELLRLGLGEEAQAELRLLGLTVPGGKSRVEDPDLQDKLWALAFLYNGAARYGQSHWVTRWHIVDHKRRWPVGGNRIRWEISYPRAWWDLLDQHATRNGFPTELLISFVREESAFDPLRESFANAIGLTQMIAPTAKRFAKGTGIKVSRETLRDPDKNVTIGSRFLAFLVDKFDRRWALVVPSYNAGEGATTRWLRERGDWAMDEFAEEIPYDETRNYSKRVLASFFAYSYLKDGTIPEMPNQIPAALRPGGGGTNGAAARMKGN